jgi:1,4-dihydroxy-2-naphthoyl-CoA hydrolase
VTNEESTAQLREVMPLAATLGMTAESYTADSVALSLEWKQSLCTANGILHGGVIMALADSAGGACALLNLPAGATGTATIESKTNFLGAVRTGTVTATSTPLHKGGTTIVVETDVRDAAGRLVAKVTQTQIVLRPR